METLIIQDVFDPYYLGRQAFAARRVRAVSTSRPTAEPLPENPLIPTDTLEAELNRPPAEPREQ
jgi:hypothetical protein